MFNKIEGYSYCRYMYTTFALRIMDFFFFFKFNNKSNAICVQEALIVNKSLFVLHLCFKILVKITRLSNIVLKFQ